MSPFGRVACRYLQLFLTAALGFSLSILSCREAQSPPPADQPTPDAAATPPLDPPPPSPGPTPTLPDDNQQDKGILTQLSDGRIAFQPPATMHQGDTTTLRVRITRSQTEDIAEGLAELGTQSVVVESIQTARRMTAVLRGPAFDIKPLTADEQVVLPSGFTTWQWTVTPLNSGTQHLYLSVGVTLQVDGRDVPQFRTVYDREIVVQVDPLYAAKLLVTSYWQWLTASIFIPLGGWAWKRWTDRKRRGPTILTP